MLIALFDTYELTRASSTVPTDMPSQSTRSRVYGGKSQFSESEKNRVYVQTPDRASPVQGTVDRPRMRHSTRRSLRGSPGRQYSLRVGVKL